MRTLSVLTLLILVTAPAAFARQPAATSLDLGRRALADRRYDDAARELEAAVAACGERADESLLLLGNALYYAKKYPEAVAVYDRLLREQPRSTWRKKALFRKADCFLALKQYDKAAAIYEPELAYLVSDARKEQVADTYLKYATQYFAPPKNPRGETPDPNFAKAKSLYEKAVEIGLTPKRREEVLLQIALCDANAGRFQQALPTLQGLLREFPKGSQAEAARQQLGLCELRLGSDRAARRSFRDFLADYPQSARRGDVAFALAQTYHVPNPADDRELDLGTQALRDFVKSYPQHEKRREAEYWVGFSYFNRQRYTDAVREFAAFLASRPGETADEIAQAKYHSGLALLRQKKYGEAIAAWEGFLREHPVHRLWNTVQRQRIDAEYAVGDDAYKAKQYETARRSWQAFQLQYPLDARNGDIMFRLGMMLHEEKQYPAAIEQWQKVASKYADSEAASRAQFMIGLAEEKNDRFDEANAAYHAVAGPWQEEAKRRLQALRTRKLLAYTERTFTTGDTAALKLLTRNVKKIAFRAYRVDLRDYFRQRHTIRDVEHLDLALIEPDQRWELAVTGFKPFKELETEAALPFKEPGLYAVTCQAELDPEEAQPYRDAGQEPPVLEATSAVWITDAGIITKFTHRDLLVFAQNLRTGEPWPNASILVSDGHRILASGKTGADGVYQVDGSGLKAQGSGEGDAPSPTINAESIRVLAYAGANCASTEGDLQSVEAAPGRQPAAYLYTDRPVYRPGQPVRLRGIVRGVERGLYAFKAGAEYDLTVLDAGGAPIRSRRVRLGDFGTFSDELTLERDAPLGQYRIMLEEPSVEEPRLSAEGSFSVATYRLDRVRLAFDLPKSVYLRGEEIKGKVTARTYYGEPLAGRKVRFGWDDELGEERETDARGEFEFTIPTRPFEEEAAVTLWARLDDDGAAAQTPVYVAVVGVRAEVSMVRDLHLAGERFEVAVRATDLAGKPFAGGFTLTALKREKEASGLFAEREVQSLPLSTEAKEGRGKVSLALAEAGDYLLRLAGKDANGNPVTADATTQVVGDEDEVRLRLLTEGDTFRAGETASVRVLWRGCKERPNDAADRLALVSYEGERIYGYQLVTLKKGENTVRVPLTAAQAPVFQLSVTLMDGNELHTASKWLRVEQPLKVTLKTEPAAGAAGEKVSYRPGDRVRVIVQTTGPDGKPVSAEVSLAAVDAALLAVAGGAPVASGIDDLLGGPGATENAVLTAGSCTFHYAAEARQQALQVREAEDMLQVMLAGVGGGEEIGPGHWAYDQLQKLGDAGLIEGWADGRFKGKATLNRIEVAGALNSALNKLGVDAATEGASYARRAGGGQSGRGRAGADRKDAENRAALGQLAEEFGKELKQQERLNNSSGANAPRSQAAAKAEQRPQSAEVEAAPAIAGRPAATFPAPPAGGMGGAPALGYDVDNGLVVRGGDEAVSVLRALDEPTAGGAGASARTRFLETAFWKPDVVTDAQGKATVEFALPDSLTEWRLDALGVNRATLAGAGETTLTASKPFLVELKTPALLQQGDRVTLAATARNHTAREIEATLSLEVTFDTNPKSQIQNPKPIKVPAGGEAVVSFPLEVPAGQSALLRLAATTNAPGIADAVEETLAVRPWGIEHLAVAGGTAQGDRTVNVKLPDGKYLSQRLRITVGPDVRTTLIEIAQSPGGDGWGQPLTESLAQRLLCLVNAVGYLRSLNRGDAPEARRLAAELEGTITRLVTAQRQDGGWPWALPAVPRQQQAQDAAAQRPGDLRVSTDAVSGLAQAKALGFRVPAAALTNGLAFLQRQFQQTGEADHATKLRILYAQSQAGGADFAPVNRLHRLRGALDARGLALLALTLHQMDRDAMALDATRLLVEKLPADGLNRYLGGGNPLFGPYPGLAPENPQDTLTLEDVALATLALAKVEPKSPRLSALVELLWAQRAGSGWYTPRDTSTVLAALIQHARATEIAPERYTLTVRVNDQEVRRLEVAGNARSATIDVPAAALPAATAKVAFTLAGRGTYTYSCVLTGFTDQGLLADSDPEIRNPQSAIRNLEVRRTVLQAPRVWNGKEVPRGFSAVSNATTWENLATGVSAGSRVQVRLNWSMPASPPGANPGLGANTFVLRDALPAGARVLEASIQGPFERYELGEGEITFFFYGRRAGVVTYDLYGGVEGEYRALPTTIWAADRPGLYAFGTTRKLQVLARGQEPEDEYRLTPDELLFLGKAHFDRVQEAGFEGREPAAADLEAVEKYLGELFDRDADPKGWKLAEAPARETTRLLFSLALRRKDAPRTVRFFEVLRERFPTVVISFNEIVETARAYRTVGEREREAQVYRATAESSFGRDARVAGVLEDEGEFRAAFAYLADLGHEYPDLPNVESSLYALAQSVAQRAEQSRGQGARTLARDLSQQAGGILRDFLALYPESPLGDEASFAYAVNLVEREQYEDAGQWCERSVALYPKSQYADDFAYMGAFACFLDEKFGPALKMAETVAAGEFPQADGGTAPSPYRPLALYIAAQVYHAMGKPGDAVKYYAQVAENFPDAREAAAYFRAPVLRVPEVVTVRGEEPARLRVSGRNVDQVQVQVYKVDLLKFYQNRRSLADLGEMNLAGIKPTWEGTVTLGPQQFVEKEQSLDLPLKEKGAYCIAAKATGGEEELRAAGVLVRTDLALDVQADAGSGRVRVNVQNRATGALQPKAEVWVVGTDNDAFRKGTTDLRGIVFADDVRGRAAVIVAKGGDYAFYRGEEVLQPKLVRTPPQGDKQAAEKPAAQPGVAFREQARALYAQQQRANEGKQNDFLRNQVMGGFAKAPAKPGQAPAPAAAPPGFAGPGGFGGGGFGGVSAGAVK